MLHVRALIRILTSLLSFIRVILPGPFFLSPLSAGFFFITNNPNLAVLPSFNAYNVTVYRMYLNSLGVVNITGFNNLPGCQLGLFILVSESLSSFIHSFSTQSNNNLKMINGF